MATNPESKPNPKLPTQLLAPNKLFKIKSTKYSQLQSSKEDYPINTDNLPTYHKLEPPMERSMQFCTIRANALFEVSFTRQRSNIFNLYSKMHYCFSLTFQSLILAIDIFDTFMLKYRSSLSPAKISQISLACFMIAIKYEEVYPPTLSQIQSKMKIKLSFYQYVSIQFKILQHLEYHLNLSSPTEYFRCFPCQINKEKKSYIYLYLELVCLNYQIKSEYSWKIVTDALKLLFRPLTQTLNSNIPPNVQECLKKLMIERCKLDECYLWLHKKYSDPKFHCMAIKPCYIGQDL